MKKHSLPLLSFQAQSLHYHAFHRLAILEWLLDLILRSELRIDEFTKQWEFSPNFARMAIKFARQWRRYGITTSIDR